MSNNVCGTIKADGTSLTWLDGVLTSMVDGEPVKVKNFFQSPCGGFKLNADVFKAVGNEITLATKEGEITEGFNPCGSLSWDASVFTLDDEGNLALRPIPLNNHNSSGETETTPAEPENKGDNSQPSEEETPTEEDAAEETQ